MMEDPVHTVKEAFTLTRDDIALEEKLRNLPAKPGVYQFRSASGDMLYVGKAVNLRNRVRQYFQKSHQFDPRLEIFRSVHRGQEYAQFAQDGQGDLQGAKLQLLHR